MYRVRVLFREFISIFASIYKIYNVLYARGTTHSDTGMAHKKQVEKIKHCLMNLCFTRAHMCSCTLNEASQICQRELMHFI